MNDAIIGAIIAAIVSAFVAIASLAFQYLSKKAERADRRDERLSEYQEWYRRTLFERPLSAVQAGYGWRQRLYDAVILISHDSSQVEQLREACRQARDWYDANALYLHDGWSLDRGSI